MFRPAATVSCADRSAAVRDCVATVAGWLRVESSRSLGVNAAGSALAAAAAVSGCCQRSSRRFIARGRQGTNVRPAGTTRAKVCGACGTAEADKPVPGKPESYRATAGRSGLGTSAADRRPAGRGVLRRRGGFRPLAFRADVDIEIAFARRQGGFAARHAVVARSPLAGDRRVLVFRTRAASRRSSARRPSAARPCRAARPSVAARWRNSRVSTMSPGLNDRRLSTVMICVCGFSPLISILMRPTR